MIKNDPNTNTTTERAELPGKPGGSSLKILLAFDNSQHAQAAVDLLCDLNLSGSQLTALAVLPTQRISGHEALQASLEKAQARLESMGMQVKADIKAGNPAATINNYALELKVDLIVIGAKGLRATLGILLGGVAQQVIEYSCCPVLVVRAPYQGIKRILAVTDGSSHSQLALEYLAPPCVQAEVDTAEEAGGIRQRCFWLPAQAEVRVMHVLPPPISFDALAGTWTVGPEVLYPVPTHPIDKNALEAEEEREGERILEQAAAILEAAGIQAQRLMVRGDAATEIIETVKKSQIDLIVCGSRGLSPVTGWLLGSVSRKLVHYAGCSVLIVKGEPKP